MSKHYPDPTGFVILTVRLAVLRGVDLRWEPSRGGLLFPHIYGDLPLAAVQAVTPALDGASLAVS